MRSQKSFCLINQLPGIQLALILIGVILTTGCQTLPKTLRSKNFQALEQRIERLEKQQSKDGPIQSITLRLGSKDDRLRIYWKDGTKSDLPCTKEHSIWSCG